MHAGAFGFYLFALAVDNVAYTIGFYLYSKGYDQTANLINDIGIMIYYTASFIAQVFLCLILWDLGTREN